MIRAGGEQGAGSGAPCPEASGRWLLVSDIDDTLTGDARALQDLADALERGRDRLWVAVNSSRPAASVAQTLREGFPANLVPDAVITALGTEIALQGAPLAGWQDRFAGWPRAEIFAALERLGHRPHPPQFQTAFKVSFAVPQADWQAARDALAAFPQRIITSGASDLDVIPPGAGKDAATLRLADTMGVDRDRLAVAGDSGNDLAMLRVGALRIAVGNARAELLDGLDGVPFVKAAAAHAGGVLEGLRRFGIL